MNDIKQNIESDAFWVRTLFTVGFFLVYGLLDVVIIFLMLVQWGFTLVTGQVNPALNQFSAGLALYIAQIVKYVTGNSELKPFAVTDWPTPKSDMPTEQ